jgi:hypothetical protein
LKLNMARSVLVHRRSDCGRSPAIGATAQRRAGVGIEGQGCLREQDEELADAKQALASAVSSLTRFAIDLADCYDFGRLIGGTIPLAR